MAIHYKISSYRPLLGMCYLKIVDNLFFYISSSSSCSLVICFTGSMQISFSLSKFLKTSLESPRANLLHTHFINKTIVV